MRAAGAGARLPSPPPPLPRGPGLPAGRNGTVFSDQVRLRKHPTGKRDEARSIGREMKARRVATTLRLYQY